MAVTFTPVTEKHCRVVIVASGPSACGFIPPDGVTVIAVNGAIDWIERADYWFTLDPSPANYARMMNQRLAQYVAAVPDTFGTPKADTSVMRRPAPENVRYLRRVTGNGVLRSRPGLSEDKSAIHTGNSAYGALGLAYHFKPQRVILIGVDGSQHERVEGGKPNSLAHLPALFATTLSQLDAFGVRVVNGSEHSAIDCFLRVDAAEATRWLLA